MSKKFLIATITSFLILGGQFALACDGGKKDKGDGSGDYAEQVMQ